MRNRPAYESDSYAGVDVGVLEARLSLGENRTFVMSANAYAVLCAFDDL